VATTLFLQVGQRRMRPRVTLHVRDALVRGLPVVAASAAVVAAAVCHSGSVCCVPPSEERSGQLPRGIDEPYPNAFTAAGCSRQSTSARDGSCIPRPQIPRPGEDTETT
jgi:hypothetical protein